MMWLLVLVLVGLVLMRHRCMFVPRQVRLHREGDRVWAEVAAQCRCGAIKLTKLDATDATRDRLLELQSPREAVERLLESLE